MKGFDHYSLVWERIIESVRLHDGFLWLDLFPNKTTTLDTNKARKDSYKKQQHKRTGRYCCTAIFWGRSHNEGWGVETILYSTRVFTLKENSDPCSFPSSTVCLSVLLNSSDRGRFRGHRLPAKKSMSTSSERGNPSYHTKVQVHPRRIPSETDPKRSHNTSRVQQ